MAQYKDNELAIKVVDVRKKYRLGTIGGGTLQGDIQSWWARVRGKEDPNSKIGESTSDKAYKRNERFDALKGISFEVKKGERVGIIGHNGAGKSTMLKLLSRVTAPTEGEIYINGRISSMLEVGTGFNPELTGRENVYLNGAILGMTKAEVDSKMDNIIEFSECKQFIDTPVKRYSSGMFVKLAFSVAAHLDSEILIMDEVLAVGDMRFQEKCLKKMSEVSQSEGRTILYVSHNMNTIRQLCDRCIVLSKGEVVYNGDVEEAINIYLGEHIDYTSASIDLDKTPRESKGFGKEFKFTKFEIPNKDGLIYKDGEKIYFDLSWKSSEKINNVFVRLEVLTAGGERVGATFSDKYSALGDNQEVTKHFEFDISNLSPGKYTVLLNASQALAYGRIATLDHVNYVSSFEVLKAEDALIRWDRKFWGSVKLNPLTEIEK